jgi:Rad3-related DNA helicase
LKIDKDDLTVDPESLKELECASCPFYADRYETGLIGDSYFYKTWSNAEIKKKGETLHFCPYYYPLYMQDHCDLILMPYSYLLDIRIFQKYEKLIKNSIIIFDEAHNVGENACSGRSFQVSS